MFILKFNKKPPYWFIFWFLVLTLMPPEARSQEFTTALERYIQLGVENNLALLNENLELEKNRSGLREARGRFLPGISFEASYFFSDGGRTIDIPVGDLFNPVHGALNELTGEQHFPGNLENIRQQLLPDDYHETRLRIIQPLFNTDLYYSYRAQTHVVSQQEARRQAMLDELVKEIRVSYYNYLKTEELLAVYRSVREMFEELVRFNRRLVENEKATVDAVYNAEYELNKVESQLTNARKVQESARVWFNFLLNRDLAAPIERDSTVIEAYPAFDLSAFQQQALTARGEISQLEQGISVTQNLLKLNRSKALPEFYAAADLGYQGYRYRFNSDQEFWLVQFGMRWNLFGGFQNRERITQSRLELKKLEHLHEELEQQIRMQVIDAWHSLEAAHSSLQAAEAGLKAAEAGFRIIRRKYEENQVLLLEYLDAQNNYTTARLQQTIARYDVLARQAELEHTAGRAGNRFKQ